MHTTERLLLPYCVLSVPPLLDVGNDSAGPAHRSNQPIGERAATARASPQDESTNRSTEQDSAALIYLIKHQSASSAVERWSRYILSPYRFLTACLELASVGEHEKGAGLTN